MSNPEFERFSPEMREDRKDENKDEAKEGFEDIIDGDERMQNEKVGEKNTENNNDEVEEDEEEDKENDEAIEEIIHRNIFLQTNENLYAPYTAHCLLLGKSTVLVILSQVFFLVLFLYSFTYSGPTPIRTVKIQFFHSSPLIMSIGFGIL